MAIRARVNQEGWQEFWRWTLAELVPQLRQEAGRFEPDVVAASVESVKLGPGPDDAHQCEEVFRFGLVVNLAGKKARPEQRRYEYRRPIVSLEDRGLTKARLLRLS